MKAVFSLFGPQKLWQCNLNYCEVTLHSGDKTQTVTVSMKKCHLEVLIARIRHMTQKEAPTNS